MRPDLTREPVSARALVPGVAALVTASAGGQLAALRANRELAALLAAPRARPAVTPTRHVLYLNPNLWFGLKAGGSVAHVSGVVNGFVETGYGVDVFSAGDPVLIRPDARFERLDPPRAFGMPFELNFQRYQRHFVHEVARRAHGPYGFVYQRNSVANYSGAVVSRRLRLPLVLEYNGSEVWAARHWGRPLRYERLAMRAEDASLRHAHLVVVVSEVLRDELLERRIEPERIVMYPNCVDPQVYDPARFDREQLAALRRRHRIPVDALVATFIGTFGHWHGAELLARAVAGLVDADEEWVRARRLHFLLVGDGLKMPDVRAVLDRDRYRPYATLTGLVPQSEGAAYLAASDILVSPHVPNPDGTPFFGSPTKLFEYMAIGKGIVASALDQIGDVLQPAVAVDAARDAPRDAVAVLVQPGDEAELARGIRLLVDDAALRARLGANARERVLSRYTWRHHVDAIVERLDALRERP